MLKLAPNPTFKAPVKIRAPGGEEFTVTFEFKHRTRDQLEAFLASSEWSGMSDAQAIMALAVGWTGAEGEFNEDNLRTICQHYQSAPGLIVQKYLSELTATKLGN